MAAYETLIYEKIEDKIVRLTLNRPEKLNALSQKLLHELDLVMDEYMADPDASVIIIRGAGRAFSAGYDLQGTQQPGSGFTVTSDRLGLHRTIERWQRLWTLPKPTIAQVHGYCLAGGTEFVGHCDIVFASEDALFGHPAGRALGILPAELLMLHKAAVNRYLDILGIRAAEQSSADIDVIAHQTDTVKNWMKASREKGLKSALTERDRPFAKKA
jgi:enoyl-CoA hydratase/carnithine racemase